MPKYKTSDIRNVALVGHGASGKTTLVEACLAKAKAVARRGSVADGTTVSDYDPDEKESKHSIDLAITHLTWKGKEVQFLDTPGYPDFIGEAIAAIHSVGAVLICVDAQDGVKVNTRKVWEIASKRNLPRAIVITRADMEHAKWEERLADIKASFGEKCIPLDLPKGDVVGPKISAIEDVFPIGLSSAPTEWPPANASDEAKEDYRAALEMAVERDEALMARYLEGETLKPDEVRRAIHDAFRAGALYPVFITAAEKDLGVTDLLDAVVDIFPLAGERTYTANEIEGGAAVEVKHTQPFTAQVVKVVYDPFVGKISYVRIYSGTLPQNSMILAPKAKGPIKVAHIYKVQGKEQQEVQEAIAGEIVALTKIEELHPGDTLTTAALRVSYPPFEYRTPMVALAVEPKARTDEGKISQALHKLCESDPTVRQHRDPQTHELIVEGMSNLHLEVLLKRLKRRYQVETTTKVPKVPYLETITHTGDAKYRHKKQTGGAGQFAEVWMRIEPQPRGAGFLFESEVVGGAISTSFIPAIEKGVRAVMEKGVIAGFPVVDVKAVVYDGKEHPVDSKDIAFQMAGRGAFREAVKQARPVLLEPIVDVEITVPNDFVGSILGDMNQRRGRISSTDSAGNLSVIQAKVPHSEMLTYSSELRSMTGGEGSYTMKQSHYDPMPTNLAQAVIAQYKHVETDE